jgi:hypothetical protein
MLCKQLQEVAVLLVAALEPARGCRSRGGVGGITRRARGEDRDLRIVAGNMVQQRGGWQHARLLASEKVRGILAEVADDEHLCVHAQSMSQDACTAYGRN